MNVTEKTTATTISKSTSLTTSTVSDDSWKSTVVYVSIGVGATILAVGLAVAVFLLVKFRRKRNLKKATTVKQDIANVHCWTNGARLCDRRLTGSSIAAVGCFGHSVPVSSDVENVNDAEFIWYTGNSSSSASKSATSGSTPSQISDNSRTTYCTPLANGNVAYYIGPCDDDEDSLYSTLHRSSPAAALAAIFAVDKVTENVTAPTSSPSRGRQSRHKKSRNSSSSSSRSNVGDRTNDGVVNLGFVGDAAMESAAAAEVAVSGDDAVCESTAVDSWWSRLSWRARLRAGISSSVASDPTHERVRPRFGGPLDRRSSYLTDVLDSLRFFSGSDLPTGVGIANATPDVEWRSRAAEERSHTLTSAQSETPSVHSIAERYGCGEWRLHKRPDACVVRVCKSSSAPAVGARPTDDRWRRSGHLSTVSCLSSDSRLDPFVVGCENRRRVTETTGEERRQTSFERSVGRPGDRSTPAPPSECQRATYYTYGRPLGAPTTRRVSPPESECRS